jgi:hypothetical protein
MGMRLGRWPTTAFTRGMLRELPRILVAARGQKRSRNYRLVDSACNGFVGIGLDVVEGHATRHDSECHAGCPVPVVRPGPQVEGHGPSTCGPGKSPCDLDTLVTGRYKDGANPRWRESWRGKPRAVTGGKPKKRTRGSTRGKAKEIFRGVCQKSPRSWARLVDLTAASWLFMMPTRCERRWSAAPGSK